MFRDTMTNVDIDARKALLFRHSGLFMLISCTRSSSLRDKEIQVVKRE